MVAFAKKNPAAMGFLGVAVLCAPALFASPDLIRELVAGPVCLENTDLVPNAIPVLRSSH